MKNYFVMGLVLILSGCGSFEGQCSNGQVNSQYGCATPCNTVTSGVVEPATSNCVLNTLSASASSACSMFPGYMLQAVPSPYNEEPEYKDSGNEVCCQSGVNLAAYPDELANCQIPISQSQTSGASSDSVSGCTVAINGGCCPFSGFPAGDVYQNGTCVPA